MTHQDFGLRYTMITASNLMTHALNLAALLALWGSFWILAVVTP